MAHFSPGPLALAWRSVAQYNFYGLPKMEYFDMDEVLSLGCQEIFSDQIYTGPHPKHFCLAEVGFERLLSTITYLCHTLNVNAELSSTFQRVSTEALQNAAGCEYPCLA